MAVTVTDNRTTLYQDGLTGVTGADTSVTDFYAEATGSAAIAYNIATGQIYFGSSLDTTVTGNEVLYVWSAIVATQNGYKEATAADSSHAMYVGDGTNNFIAYMAGNDRDAFKHSTGQVSFQCFMVDMDYMSTANTNGDIAFLDGSFASLNEASITRIGAHYTTLSKALGGGQNCYMDIIRVGGADDGISITGGTTGDRGTFEEICVEDRSDLDGKAHGIIREYTGGAYGCQGTLKFGTTAAGDSWFEDTAFSLTFEDRLVADDKFKLVVLGNTTGGEETHFILSNGTIQTARPGVAVDMSSTGINTLTLTTVTFLNLLNAIDFPTDSASYSHSVTGCTFNSCGQISPGSVTFTNNSVLNTNNATSALLWDQALDTDGLLDGTSFTTSATDHAIEITSFPVGDEITLRDIEFNGYANSDGSVGNEAIYVNIGSGTYTINIVGGSGTPSVRTAGASVTVVQDPVTTTITVVDIDDGLAIENANVYVTAAAGGPLAEGTVIIGTSTLTDVNGEVSDTRSLASNQPITGRVRRASPGFGTLYKTSPIAGTINSSAGLSVTVQMIKDE